MKSTHLVFAALALALCLGSTAQADWADDFDSYAQGSGLHGQGGWEGWLGDPAWDAYVTDAFSQSAPHSVEITPTSDIVQQFAETSGEWIMTGSCYIPSGSFGLQYFILLNTYAGSQAWSLQIMFDSDAGMLSVAEGTGTTYIVNDQWVEVRVEIDLDSNLQTIYYDGDLLDLIPWVGTGGGVQEIGALDLFSNAGSSIYWDDLSLVGAGTPTEKSTWGSIKASYR